MNSAMYMTLSKYLALKGRLLTCSLDLHLPPEALRKQTVAPWQMQGGAGPQAR